MRVAAAVGAVVDCADCERSGAIARAITCAAPVAASGTSGLYASLTGVLPPRSGRAIESDGAMYS